MEVGSGCGSSCHSLSKVAREVLSEQSAVEQKVQGGVESYLDIWGKNFPAERVVSAETPGRGVLKVP